ncbi:beta-1,4-mannosyl-glycoprotein 4-beta-N-acetylglucosaminyltransferase-like isoform X2 [Ornithodoros turicata]|uniref:beta-1,4-mannosyl-glycoprotein 4-beta-N-acetylglucosaminyltransferase-like isoform X2 n=1 Tax=Ornithodoros turicata TaxID=34597 RepID=UPI003139079A
MTATVSEKKSGLLSGLWSVRRVRTAILCFVVFNVVAIGLFLTQTWRFSRAPARDRDVKCRYSDYRYSDILNDVLHLPLHRNRAMNAYYFSTKDQWCFKAGTHENESMQAGKCVCVSGFHGKDCGIFESVWRSSFLKSGTVMGAWVRRRARPRRIVSVFLANSTQFDLVKLHLDYLGEVVDAFVIGHEGRELFKKINETYNRTSVYSKIVSVVLQEAKLSHLLDQLWRRVSDFRLDDLFLWTDPTALPFVETIVFMKLYDGFSEPVRFYMRDLAHTFLWQKPERPSETRAVHLSTFALVHSLCRFNHLCILSGTVPKLDQSALDAFTKMTGWNLQPWSVGNSSTPSGWNCRDCLVIPNSIDVFANQITNSTNIPHQWLTFVSQKLQERRFNIADVHAVSYGDSHLAPSPLLERPGPLWYMVPYALNEKTLESES